MARAGLDISVSVNVRRATRRSRTSRSAWRSCWRVTPSRWRAHLELEMLETAAHADIEATSALLARCRTLGVRFALDDFGTGYSPHLPSEAPAGGRAEDRPQLHYHMLDDAGPRHRRRRDRPGAHLRLHRGGRGVEPAGAGLTRAAARAGLPTSARARASPRRCRPTRWPAGCAAYRGMFALAAPPGARRPTAPAAGGSPRLDSAGDPRRLPAGPAFPRRHRRRRLGATSNSSAAPAGHGLCPSMPKKSPSFSVSPSNSSITASAAAPVAMAPSASSPSTWA